MKALGIQQTGFIPHGDKLDAIRSRIVLQVVLLSPASQKISTFIYFISSDTMNLLFHLFLTDALVSISFT